MLLRCPRVLYEAFEVMESQEMNLEELQNIWKCQRKWIELKGRNSSCFNYGRDS